MCKPYQFKIGRYFGLPSQASSHNTTVPRLGSENIDQILTLTLSEGLVSQNLDRSLSISLILSKSLVYAWYMPPATPVARSAGRSSVMR